MSTSDCITILKCNQCEIVIRTQGDLYIHMIKDMGVENINIKNKNLKIRKIRKYTYWDHMEMYYDF